MSKISEITMRLKLSLLSLAFFVITACAGNPESEAALQCERGLQTAYKELDFAEARGFGGTVEYTKAASLLTAAKVQFEFGKYPNCIDKVKHARSYIRVSQQ